MNKIIVIFALFVLSTHPVGAMQQVVERLRPEEKFKRELLDIEILFNLGTLTEKDLKKIGQGGYRDHSVILEMAIRIKGKVIQATQEVIAKGEHASVVEKENVRAALKLVYAGLGGSSEYEAQFQVQRLLREIK